VLNQKRLRGSSFFKTVFYFPNLVTAVSLGVLFSLLFDWKVGSVNQVLMSLHLISEPINWKGNALYSQLIVAFVLFWQYFGYCTKSLTRRLTTGTCFRHFFPKKVAVFVYMLYC